MFLTTIASIVAVASIGFVLYRWWRRSGKTASITALAGGLIPEKRLPTVIEIVAKLVGWGILLLSISWIFPDFVKKYEAQGGPTWLLYFMLVGAGIVWSSGTSKVGRPAIASGLALIAVGSAMVFTAITWIHGDDKSRGENEAAQRRVQAQLDQQAAIAAATPGLIPQLGTALWGNQPPSVSSKCDGKTEWPFRYELHFKEVPEQENCGATFKMKDNRTYEVRYRDGHTTVLRDGPGKTIIIDPFAKEVRAVDEAFDAYIVLYPPQRR